MYVISCYIFQTFFSLSLTKNWQSYISTVVDLVERITYRACTTLYLLNDYLITYSYTIQTIHGIIKAQSSSDFLWIAFALILLESSKKFTNFTQ